MTTFHRPQAESGRRSDDAAEVTRLKLRLRELGAAMRNRQETFNRMLEQLQAREEEAVQLAGERAARAAAEEAAKRLRFLAEASGLLASSLDYKETLAGVVRLAVPAVADAASIGLLDEAGRLRPTALHQRSAAVSLPTVEAEGAAADGRTRVQAGSVVVPLIAGGDVLGVLAVCYAESARRYTPDDVALIEDLGRRAATAIRTARLVHGLEEARGRLEDQAQELEAQTEELQQTTEELELNSQELHRTNEELARKSAEAERARQVAEAANAAKSEFLAMMSHELRTPLNAIGGYGELLAMEIHGPLTGAQAQAIDRIRRSQQRLLVMINDILNFARLEAGKMEMNIGDVPVGESFGALEATIEPQMRLKGLRYTFEVCDRALLVRADREKMEQVLLNLLSNAVKFTDSGGTVRVWCEVDASLVRVHVSDTGRGISADRLAQIFEPFVQLVPGRSGGAEGVGLGLAISRDLARSMGGELSVRSAVGEGSTFTLQLERSA